MRVGASDQQNPFEGRYSAIVERSTVNGRTSTARDDVLSGGDPNLYAYCVGDPVGLADPAGLRHDAGGGGGAGDPACGCPGDGTPYGRYNLQLRPSLPAHDGPMPDRLDMGMEVATVFPVITYIGSGYLFGTNAYQWSRGDAPFGDPLFDIVGTVYPAFRS